MAVFDRLVNALDAAREARRREGVIRDGAFGHGYLVRRGRGHGGAPVPDLVRGWSRRRVGGFDCFLHPRTRVSRFVADGVEVVLLGHPVDVDAGTADGTAIARRIAEEVSSGDPVRYAAYLGGRWTLFLHQGDGRSERLRVVPDTHASQAVFWSRTGGLALGSQSALVADALGLGPDERAMELFGSIRTLRKTGVIYLPGLLTPHENVLPLVPNCLLDVRVDHSAVRVDHTRFWPFEERRERTDLEQVAADFRDRMREHTRLLTTFGGRVAISLTGGLDSRMSLAGFLPHVRARDFAFTYFNPRDGVKNAAAAEDVFTANRIAFDVGLPHRVLRWRNPGSGAEFREIYARTYPVQPGSMGAAHAMWADLPHDIVHLQSIGGETGTVFARDRTDDPISPARLAALWLGPRFAADEYYVREFEPYLEYAGFTPEAMRGYDHHDVNYWEHRIGKWGYRKFQDGDFGHRILLPFNDRRLIEIMLSVPEEDRISKVLYHRTLAEHPQLTADPC